MISRLSRFSISCYIVAAGIVVSCSEKQVLPARADIPLIKEMVSKVEAGVRDRNQAALDSVMSIKMLDTKVTSDSLISLVWNSIPLARFARFSDCEVAYSTDIAKCDCGITDEAGKTHAGISLTFSREDKRWLLRECKLKLFDSLQ